jgi:transcriptional regulator with XRE-family HTH domain
MEMSTSKKGVDQMVENRVKEFRERAGLSQVELSRRSKIAAPNLSDIERGQRLPWEKAKRAIARALKTTPDELFPDQLEGGVKNG